MFEIAISFAIGTIFGVVVVALVLHLLTWWQENEPMSVDEAWEAYCEATRLADLEKVRQALEQPID